MVRLNLRLGLGKRDGVISPPAAPVASDATSVMDTSFVANWEAVTGATSYERRYLCS